MPKIYAKCPRCDVEVQGKRSVRWRMSVVGHCPSCGVDFTTASFWESNE